MLFDFFKKTQKTEEDNVDNNDILARISYIVFKDGDSTTMDVELEDYSDQSIEALCQIIDSLAEDSALLETMNIVKNGLVSEGREDCLLKIFNRISKHTKTRIINSNNKIEEPCIRPLDVFTR
jgi:hypothetical protein